jgi:uncharacterized protein YkwD
MKHQPNKFAPTFRRSLLTTVLVTLGTLLLPLPPASAAVTFEERMLQLVNEARAGAGAAPLVVSTTVAGIASNAPYQGCGYPVAGRSADMGVRNYFSHTIANCGTQAAPDMLRAAGMSAIPAENIAWVSGITDPLVAAQRLHNDLMASPVHRANIMNGAFTHVGVGSWATATGASWSGGGTPLRNVYLTTEIFITQTVPPITTRPPTNVAVFRPSNGSWYFRTPTPSVVSWGKNGDVPVPGDYNGDGVSDLAVFRPSTNTWEIRTPTPQSVKWGEAGDIPVPADYDGNGTTDVAVFRPATGTWFLRTATPTAPSWGQNGDIPVPGDYNGDRKADLAVFRPSNNAWYLRTPTTQFISWGEAGDIPVPADYDGNGTTDVGNFRPSNGTWYLRTPIPTAVAWGTRGDIPAPGDYDGNGTAELAVFRPGTSSWYLRTPSPQFIVWGEAGDKPLPLPDAIRRFF